jgi:hypothetical protein
MKEQEQKEQKVQNNSTNEEISSKYEKDEQLWELRMDLSGFANTTSGH